MTGTAVKPYGGSLSRMAQFVALLILIGGFAAILGGIAWLAARIRRRGLGGAFMGPFEEIYHPAAHQARQEIRTHEERTVPVASADDQL